MSLQVTFRSTGKPQCPVAHAFSVPPGREGPPAFHGEDARGHPARRVSHQGRKSTCCQWESGELPCWVISSSLCDSVSYSVIEISGVGGECGGSADMEEPTPFTIHWVAFRCYGKKCGVSGLTGGGPSKGLQSCLGLGDAASGQDSGPASRLPTC